MSAGMLSFRLNAKSKLAASMSFTEGIPTLLG